MNKFILNIFKNFLVNGVEIPVVFLNYEGKSEAFVTFQEVNFESIRSDDTRQYLIHNFDFDIYTKESYKSIADSLIQKLEDAGANLIPALCSGDMFETDTKYYHKTLCFELIEALEREE